ncbi:CHAT domain-containing protein [Baaleninema sp.]|uniref:CHAT domain-containing protein n=1 Tax=Baaleninema sp. TaxID=3101197 RepID=UPI003D043A4B
MGFRVSQTIAVSLLGFLFAGSSVAQSLDAETWYDRCRELTDNSAFREARSTCTQALDAARAQNQTQLEAWISDELGYTYRKLGELDRALAVYDRALDLYDSLGDREGLERTYNNIGVVYQIAGNYAAALEQFDRALQLVRQRNERFGEAVLLNNIGELYRRLGQPQLARSRFEAALAISRELGEAQLETIFLGNIGAAAHDLEQFETAIDYYERSLALAEDIGDRQQIPQMLVNLGATYERLQQFDRAILVYRRSLPLLETLGDAATMAQSLNNLGSAHRQLGESQVAIEYYQRAIELRREIGDRAGIAVTANNLGVAQWELGALEAATDSLYQSIEMLESLRPGLVDRDRVSIFEKQAQTYSILQKVLVDRGEIETALEVAERGKARAFLELLARRRSPEDAEALARDLVPPPTLAEIRELARNRNATLVEYSIVSDNLNRPSDLFIWVIKNTGEIHFRSVSIDLNTEIVPILTSGSIKNNDSGLIHGLVRSTYEAVREDLPGIDISRLNRNLRSLDRLLVEPISDLLPDSPDSPLIIIPHQTLLLVPFAALKDENGQFFIEKHAFSIVPGIQVLDYTNFAETTRSNAPKHSEILEALIIGNPQMPDDLPPLPGTEREAIEIANLLGTQPLIGRAANEAAVMGQLPRSRVVHFATHGTFRYLTNSSIPGGVALTATDDGDGWLTSDELQAIGLPQAELVVLSACNTALGAITSDGILGLSRSLLAAGTPRAIVSLWQIDDEASVVLMTNFYRHWLESGSASVALRQAMLEAIEDNFQPKDWAAFLSVGEFE